VGVGVGVGVGFAVGVGVGVGAGVGVMLPTGTSEILSIVTVFKRLKRRLNQSLVAEGMGPT
jgi:hypothetical protein